MDEIVKKLIVEFPDELRYTVLSIVPQILNNYDANDAQTYMKWTTFVTGNIRNVK